MTRDQDLDQLMRAWVDVGEDRLPLHHLHRALAEIATTRQRGARWAPLEELLMRAQPLALVLAIGTLLVVAVGVFAIGAAPSGTGGRDPGVTNEPEPTATSLPSAITSGDLDFIAFTDQEVILGLTQDEARVGVAALVAGLRGEAGTIDPTGFVDARFNQFSGLANHDAQSPVRIATFAAAFDTTGDAERVYRVLREEQESASGWSLKPEPAQPSLGDEAVSYTGPAWDSESITMYLWRSENLVLATVGLDATERIHVLQVASRMDNRAN